ncbi:hypothetical protein PoB_005696100 [Plakobranchus ocellatus]|uniref:Uncharacterized protein n=1 Tax=Plakobranchus ocellatus TaxID=259542 RepID=A0AAV4CCH6_9GAST|nr:hypothetical protein PoB_005696100 [Plakobranchus ocellatus]
MKSKSPPPWADMSAIARGKMTGLAGRVGEDFKTRTGDMVIGSLIDRFKMGPDADDDDDNGDAETIGLCIPLGGACWTLGTKGHSGDSHCCA